VKEEMEEVKEEKKEKKKKKEKNEKINQPSVPRSELAFCSKSKFRSMAFYS
jgi:hypothetical protein